MRACSFGSAALPDKQVPAVEAEPDGHHDQQRADRDGSGAVPDRRSGQLAQHQPGGRENQADEGGAVLEQRGLDRRVRTAPDVVEELLVAAPGLAAHCVYGPDQRCRSRPGTRGPARCRRPRRMSWPPVRRRASHPLVKGKPRAGDEDADSGEQRPEEPFLTVSEWVRSRPVGRRGAGT